MRTFATAPGQADTPTPVPARPGVERGPLSVRVAHGAYRRLYRNRRHLPPLAASLVLGAYGQAISALPNGIGGALAMDAALPAAVLAARAWRRTKPYTGKATKFLYTHRALPTPPNRPMSRAETIRTSAAAGAAGLLLTAGAITHTGPFQAPMTGLWWLALTPATALPWWWRRRIRAKTAPAGPDRRIALWEEKVGAARGALPGSRLVELVDRPEDGAWQALVELDSGRQNAAAAVNATTMIASAYSLPVSSIAIDRLPGGAEDRAKLLVFERNPLKSVPVFPGPQALDLTTGIAQLGLHIDGLPAQYQMWRPGWGAVHTHGSGATGAGKSAFLRQCFTIERHSGGLITSWGGDPQDGASFGFWQDYLSYFAPGVDECMGMLIAADTELTRRAKQRASSTWTDDDGDTMWGETDWTPTVEQPLISITIDEWQEVWGAYPEAIDYAVRIAILGRKVGIKLRLMTHLPTLESLGSAKLRQPLTAGNNIAFRTTERSAGYVVNLPADPNDIPAVWPDEPGVPTSGMGYLKGTEERAAMFRTWTPEPRGVATRWAKTGTPGTISPEAAQAIGPAYTEWRERLAARRRGEIPPVPGVTEAETEIEGFEADFESAAPGGRGGKKPATRKPFTTAAGGKVVPVAVSFAKPSAAASGFEQQVSASAAGTPARGEKKRAVLALLATEGEATTGILASRLNLSLSTVSSTLKRAAAAGEITDLGHGHWATNHPETAAA